MSFPGRPVQRVQTRRYSSENRLGRELSNGAQRMPNTRLGACLHARPGGVALHTHGHAGEVVPLQPGQAAGAACTVTEAPRRRSCHPERQSTYARTPRHATPRNATRAREIGSCSALTCVSMHMTVHMPVHAPVRVPVRMRVHFSVHGPVHFCTQVHAQSICMLTHTPAHMSICVCSYACTCAYICLCTCLCTCLHTYVCTHVCAHVYAHVYTQASMTATRPHHN